MMETDRGLQKFYSTGDPDQFNRRCRRRLAEDLGVNLAGAEVILMLRQQVLELQRQVHSLEAELASRQQERQDRLARYHEWLVEAVWLENLGEDE